MKKYRGFIFWLVAISCVVGAWFLFPVKDWILEFGKFMQGLGVLGVIGFGVAYALGTILLVPGSMLTLAAGVAYGYWGIPLVVVSASVGASLAFLIARYFAKDKVRNYFKKKPKIKVFEEAVNKEGWKIVAMLRLSPVFPFNFQNYFFGITEIEFWPYAVTSAFAIIPGSALYVYLGTLGADSNEGGGLKWTFFAIGLIATLIAGWIIRKNMKRITGISVALPINGPTNCACNLPTEIK